jgi:D-glycero-beta-D-manno-heptose 1-phosphate adenylyltransferase
MKHTAIIQQKIFSLSSLQKEVNRWRFLQKKIAFTNGCFDILHEGHIFSLSAAAKEADILIVGLNSDASTGRLKGDSRPINNQHSRALLLASLIMIDAVVIFDEDTPQNLITTLIPDVLVKGGDYTVEQVVGAKEVIANGGRVVINNIVDGVSTTGLIAKIQQL